jgi:hypothetical protein
MLTSQHMCCTLHMCCRNTADYLVPVFPTIHFPHGHQACKGSDSITLTGRPAHEANYSFLLPATSLGSSVHERTPPSTLEGA